LKRLREARMGEADEADQRLQGAVDTQVQPQGADLVARQVGEELRGPQRPEPLKLPGEGELAEDGDELARPDDLVNRRRGEQNLPEADADVFLDVLLAIREKQALEASDRPSDDESALPEIDRRDPVQSMIDRRVERTKDNRVVIHRLEGKTPSTFNDFMKQGREALRQGRFYRAARQYELAAMNRPRNPLPFVGRGLSAFASGEYHTAAVNLRRALELFPALMETQLDFNTLLPTRGFDLHTQMHHLEQWMAQIQARQPVRFLATFIYHNQGKNELAKHHAEAIVNADGAVDPIYKAYAQYVLTGKKPAELIENAPGKNPADAPTEGK
ncbi:MAG: hypothetical protein KGY81_02290, partial [Phycisphaerae bacterium]|nr:hypothetical protein [Phycisphaerae bacterium]